MTEADKPLVHKFVPGTVSQSLPAQPIGKPECGRWTLLRYLTTDWSKVTCPACLALKGPNDA